MEKNIHRAGPVRRILITGPESTGKSELAAGLVARYGGILVPEYARSYVENLGRPYTFEDVEHIAKHQQSAYQVTEHPWVFFDTWLLITKVWFEIVFKKVPGWLENAIRSADFELVLLCSTDIPWIPDPVRENGGEMREKLFEIYIDELDRVGLPWALVTGTGRERLDCAIHLINTMVPHGTT